MTTGAATEYIDAEVAALEAAAEQAWQNYVAARETPGTPTYTWVRANVEWSGESRGVRDTNLGPLRLAEFITALERAARAREQAQAARPLASYRAKGPLAQWRQLQRTKSGRALLRQEGAVPSAKTVRAWLLGRTPSKAYRDRIARAYEQQRQQPVTRAQARAQEAAQDAAERLTNALRWEYGVEIRLRDIERLWLGNTPKPPEL